MSEWAEIDAYLVRRFDDAMGAYSAYTENPLRTIEVVAVRDLRVWSDKTAKPALALVHYGKGRSDIQRRGGKAIAYETTFRYRAHLICDGYENEATDVAEVLEERFEMECLGNAAVLANNQQYRLRMGDTLPRVVHRDSTKNTVLAMMIVDFNVIAN